MKRKSRLDSAASGQPRDYSIGSWIYDRSLNRARYDGSCKEIFKGWNHQIFGLPLSPSSPPIEHERNEIFSDPSKFDSDFCTFSLEVIRIAAIALWMCVIATFE
ncbi:hypothetical protein NL676_010798 [Syzygium grande]|nr:hypothetical protein NL676_010798 [Syzygium grande]